MITKRVRTEISQKRKVCIKKYCFHIKSPPSLSRSLHRLPTYPHPKGNRTMDHVNVSADVAPNISGGKMVLSLLPLATWPDFMNNFILNA